MNLIAFATFTISACLAGLVLWHKTRRQKLDTSDSLFFANRNLGSFSVGASLLFANIGASEYIGGSEAVYINNMSIMAWGVSSVIAILIISEFILPVYLRGAMSTTPDFLKERYDSSTKRWVSFIFLISYMINLLPVLLYSGAVALNGLFHFSETFSFQYSMLILLLVVFMGIVGSMISILGGLKTISVSARLLAVGLLITGLLISYLGLNYLGKGNFERGLHIILSSKKEHLNAIGASKDLVPFGTVFTGMFIINLFYWGTEQVIVQQALAAKNLGTAQRGFAIACTGKLLGPFLFYMPGIIALHIYPSMKNTAEVFPRLVSGVSPPVIVGLMASIIFGAVIASFSAGLNSASTLFTLNIYKPYKEKRSEHLSEIKLISVAKRFEIFACLIAILIAPLILFVQEGLFTYTQKISSIFSVPIFTIMLVGFITKRVPPVAAKIGLLFSVCSAAFIQIFMKTSVHYLHMLAIVFLLTVLMMFIIGKLYPLKLEYNPVNKHRVDLKPWKNRQWITILLLMIMILIYALFSPLGIAL